MTETIALHDVKKKAKILKNIQNPVAFKQQVVCYFWQILTTTWQVCLAAIHGKTSCSADNLTRRCMAIDINSLYTNESVHNRWYLQIYLGSSFPC